MKILKHFYSVSLVVLIVFFAVHNAGMSIGNFELMPTNIHFFGSVATSKNIISYGNLGTIVYSTNLGKNWFQKTIKPFNDIRKIIDYRDTLWGVMIPNIVITSADHGMNWEQFILDIPTSDTLVNILLADNSIYIRTFQSVYQFDYKLNQLSFNSDTVISVKGRNKTMLPSIVDLYSYDGMFFVNNRILVDSYYKDGIVTLAPDLKNIQLIKLRDKIVNENPKEYTVYSVMTVGSKTVINLSGNLYYTNADFSDWTYFFGDSTIYNRMDPQFYQKWGNLFYYSTFSNNNQLFIESYESDNYKKIFNGGQYFTSVFDLGYKVYDEETKRFKNFNSLFYNKYYTSSYIDIFGLSSLSYLIRMKETIMNDSIFIKSGYCKSIILSDDNCKSWRLISNLSGTPRTILNDSTYYYINQLKYKNDINRTTDCGVTFMPTEFGLDTLPRQIVRKDSIGMPIDTVMVSDSVTYFGIYNKTLLFEINEDGRGFWAGPEDNPSQKVNFAYTTDGGKHFKFKRFKNLDLGSADFEKFSSNIKRIGDKYLFCINILNPNLINDPYLSNLYLIDTSFAFCYDYFYNPFFEIYYILADNLEHFRVLTKAQDNDLANIRVEVKETNDSGKTFNTVCTLANDLTIDQIYEHNTDSLFFTTSNPGRLFLYDRVKNKFIQLYENIASNTIKIMYIDNVFFLAGEKLFLKNTDRADLSKWNDGNWEYGTPTFESVIFKGNVALAKLQDDVHPLDYYRITPNKITDVSDYEIDIKYYNNHFYASPAFPSPAGNIIKSYISWDMSFELSEALKGVYNLYGDKIEGNENIRINILGKSSAELIWQRNDLASGTYFILFVHNGVSDIVPFVIRK